MIVVVATTTTTVVVVAARKTTVANQPIATPLGHVERKLTTKTFVSVLFRMTAHAELAHAHVNGNVHSVAAVN